MVILTSRCCCWDDPSGGGNECQSGRRMFSLAAQARAPALKVGSPHRADDSS